MDRAARICRAHLYVRPSYLKRYRNRRCRYEIPIGNGLFSSRDIPCDDTHIVYFFVGELMTDPVVINSRHAQNEQGGYYVLSNATKTVASDCFDTSIRGQYLSPPMSVTALNETIRLTTMRAVLTKHGATASTNGV